MKKEKGMNTEAKKGHPGIYFVFLQGEKMLHLCAREGATDCLEFLINKGKGRQKKSFCLWSNDDEEPLFFFFIIQ